jgi:predicted transcriptional regulator
MKRKPAGSNHKAIETFLMDGSASAIDIKRATKVKGNIYQTLNKMVSLGLIKKVGTKYNITLAPETQSKPEHNARSSLIQTKRRSVFCLTRSSTSVLAYRRFKQLSTTSIVVSSS